AAEIAAGQQDRTAIVLRLVEGEIRGRRTIGLPAPIIEGVLAQTGAFGGGQEPRRNDLVGVDVGLAQHDAARGQGTEAGHHATSLANSSRGSATWPFTAAHAALIGEASSVREPGPWRPSKLR